MARTPPVFLLAFLFAATAAPARAHESRPLAILIEETGPGRYALNWRAPASVGAENAPEVNLGPPCRPIAATRSRAAYGGGAVYECGGARPSMSISWPLYNPSIAGLVRVSRRSGEISTTLLSPDVTEWPIPAPESLGGVADGYFRLGVKHILSGVDHVLFLVGLLFLARTPRRIILTATGFTLAHSLTLALVALDAIRVSAPAVEATIALSIVFVAAEIARGNRTTFAWRRPILVAGTFGLLHGAGFAAALGEAGLPQTEKVAALLFFNLGVEAGQLLLIAGAFGAAFAIRRRRLAALGAPPVAERATAYGVGVVAAFWFIERSAAALT